MDSIGPDELRLTYNGVQLSKECLRQPYRGTSWHEATQQAKSLAKERGQTDWKSICTAEFTNLFPHRCQQSIWQRSVGCTKRLPMRYPSLCMDNVCLKMRRVWIASRRLSNLDDDQFAQSSDRWIWRERVCASRTVWRRFCGGSSVCGAWKSSDAAIDQVYLFAG